MGQVIHAVKKPKRGTGYWFRIWSDTLDRYVTDPISQTELKKILVAEAKEEARKKLLDETTEINFRIMRAKNTGTSSMVPGDAPLEQWKQEKKP